jgi:hypothetical protein
VSTQYLLIKPDTAERYDLWGRQGLHYFDSRFSSMELKARGLSKGVRFRIRDAYPDRDDFILAVAEDVVRYAPEWAGAPSQLDWATHLVDGITAWAGDDELWFLADMDMDDWPWSRQEGKMMPDGRRIVLTGSGYSDAELEPKPDPRVVELDEGPAEGKCPKCGGTRIVHSYELDPANRPGLHPNHDGSNPHAPLMACDACMPEAYK